MMQRWAGPIIATEQLAREFGYACSFDDIQKIPILLHGREMWIKRII